MEAATWHFVRHAESVANAERWLAGHVDAPLTARGRAQAAARAPVVAALPLDRVLTSDLSRAWQTAEILVGERGPRPQRIPELRERHLGAWERVSRDELDAGADALMRWDLGPPGGESPRTVARRYCAVFAQLDPVAHTLVVGHGLALKSVLGLLDRIAPDDITERPYGNVQLETRTVAAERWAELVAAIDSGRL